MQITGRCHCGQIAYRAEVDPDRVYICHCTDCQSISGAPFRWGVPVPEADFELLAGQPKTYVKVADSGEKCLQVFCPECASPLYSTTVTDGPGRFNLRLGSADQRAQLPPRIQLWHRSAQPWVDDVGRVDALEKQ